MNPEEEDEEDDANIDLNSQRKGKCVVLKTSTRQIIFLPIVGLGDPNTLKPGDLIGVNKDSYLILDTLPSEYDSRTTMIWTPGETDSRTRRGNCFAYDTVPEIRCSSSKRVLLYRPPGTGKTLMAQACAAQTNATFLLLSMFIEDGAKLVRDAFQKAKGKSPRIIFIDEIDAMAQSDLIDGHFMLFDHSEVSGDRDVQRTMLELLNQLDGFSSDDRIKIEFPHPTEEARARILQIHSRKMNVHPDVNFKELARSTDDFNGAQLKDVCVEAGMLALRRDATEVTYEDFNEGIIQVQAKK
ncbi:hypothetical protein H5410_041041, partial [Solanum commersonii]